MENSKQCFKPLKPPYSMCNCEDFRRFEFHSVKDSLVHVNDNHIGKVRHMVVPFFTPTRKGLHVVAYR